LEEKHYFPKSLPFVYPFTILVLFCFFTNRWIIHKCWFIDTNKRIKKVFYHFLNNTFMKIRPLWLKNVRFLIFQFYLMHSWILEKKKLVIFPNRLVYYLFYCSSSLFVKCFFAFSKVWFSPKNCSFFFRFTTDQL